MRIEGRSTQRRVVRQSDRIGGDPGSKLRVTGAFRADLSAAEERLAQADLDTLLRDVDRTAADLKRYRGAAQLAAYRKAVQAFVEAALERMYVVSTETRFDRRGAHVRSLIVRKLDEQLEALTEEVLHGPASALALAARMDEIRGLLLDLYS